MNTGRCRLGTSPIGRRKGRQLALVMRRLALVMRQLVMMILKIELLGRGSRVLRQLAVAARLDLQFPLPILVVGGWSVGC